MTNSEPSSTDPGIRPATYAKVLFGYLVLTLAMTWPVAADLNKYVISDYMDSVSAFFNIWWFHKAVMELHVSPWNNILFDYPYGYSMVFFPIWFPYNILTLPIVHLLGNDGLPIAFNLVILASFTASGFAMFVLVRYLVKDTGAAFVAGIALAFAPFRMWNIARWHLTCFELVIVCLYFFMRMVRNESQRAWMGFAAGVSLLVYTSPNYSADLVVAVLIIFIFLGVTETEKVYSRDTAWRLAKAGAVIVLICSPMLVRVGTEAINQPIPMFHQDSLRVPYSANLSGFIFPGGNLKAYSWLAPRLPYADLGLSREHGIAGYEIFMGLTVIVLAAVGALKDWRRSKMFLILALFFIVLSLGPVVHIGAHTFNWSTPFKWLEPVLPWLKINRAPVRHSAIALISIVALSGIGLATLCKSLSPGKRILLQTVVACAVILEFNQAPLKVDQVPVPAFVKEIAADPGPGSVLDLPWLANSRRYALFHHIHHGKPLAIQLTARIDDPDFQSGPIYRYFDRPRVWLEFSDEERSRSLAELKEEMKKREIIYIVAYPRFMQDEDIKGLKEVLGDLGPEAVLVENDVYIAYRFAPWLHLK